MSEQKTEDLIDTLVDTHCAIKCMRHPAICSAGTAVISIVYLSILVPVLGLRGDFPGVLLEPIFLFENGLMLAIAVTAFLASAWLRIPDIRGQQWIVAVPLTLFFVFSFWIGTRVLEEGVSPGSLNWHNCFKEAIFMSVLPVVVIVMMARQGNTTRPYLMAAMNVLAVSALGYIGLRLTCGADSLNHIGPYHILPYMVLGFVVGIAGRKLYRW